MRCRSRDVLAMDTGTTVPRTSNVCAVLASESASGAWSATVRSSSPDIVVTRGYTPDETACVRALGFLLKQLPSNRGGPDHRPKDAKVRSKNGSRATEKYT